MVHPHGVNLPESCLLSKPSDSIECASEPVFEQVTSIKGDHRDKVGKAKKDIDPHQPEKEVNKEQPNRKLKEK